MTSPPNELAISARMLHAVHESSPIGTILCQSRRNERGEIVDFTVDYVNPAGARQTGREVADYNGKTWLEVFPGTRDEGLFDIYCKVVETGEMFQQEVEYRRDGVDAWFRLTAVKIDDGFVIRFEDVSDAHDARESAQLSEERLSFALKAGRAIGAWDWDIKANQVRTDEQFAAYYGVSPSKAADGLAIETFVSAINADDREHVSEAIKMSLETGEPFGEEYRLTGGDGIERWVLARGQCYYDANGAPDRFPGVAADITEHKEAEAHRELLLGELNHRLKNSLATIQAMVGHTLRNSESMEDFRSSFSGRLAAIAASHDSLIEQSDHRARLDVLIRRQIGAYVSDTEGRVTLDGPKLVVDATVAHALGLVFHELATNASKYGALSTDTGQLSVQWEEIDLDGAPGVYLIWIERGGPPVTPPAQKGFGSRLIETTLSYTLDGTAETTFDSDGVSVHIRSPLKSQD